MDPLDSLDEHVSEEDIGIANKIFGIDSEPLPTTVAEQPWRICVTNLPGDYFIISRHQTQPTQLKGDTTSWEEAVLSEVLDDELLCIMRRQEFEDLMAGRVQFLVATLTPFNVWLKSYATPEDLPQKYKV